MIDPMMMSLLQGANPQMPSVAPSPQPSAPSGGGGLAGFMNNPMTLMGMGLLGGNYGPNSRAAFANAMRGGMLGVQQAGVSQARQAQTQMAQQQLLMQQAKAKREKEERERMEAYISTLPPDQQAMARGNPELFKIMMTQKYQQQYAPPTAPTAAPSNIREWQAFQRMTPDQQQQYLTMKRAQPWIDTGPTHIAPSPTDPTQVRAVVQKGLKPGERPEVQAEQTARKKEAEIKAASQAQAQVDLPGLEIDMETTKGYIDELRKHPGLESGTGFSSLVPVVPGTDRAAFEARRQQIQAGAFLTGFQQLKGGGPITEVEGLKAERAVARMEAATSKEAFLIALKDYENAMDAGYRKLKRRAGISESRSTTAPAAGKVIDFNDL